jgi:hypothetical protein
VADHWCQGRKKRKKKNESLFVRHTLSSYQTFDEKGRTEIRPACHAVQLIQTRK